MAKRMNFPKRREQRCISAQERQERRDKRSNADQLQVILKRGASPDCREAIRLGLADAKEAEVQVVREPAVNDEGVHTAL